MGGAIAIGLLLAAAAFVFGGGGSSSAEDCGRVVMTPDKIMPKLDLIVAVVTSTPPSANGFDALSKIMKLVHPECSWSRTTTATIVGANGIEFNWQQLVAAVGSKTVGELEVDPEFNAIFNGGKQGIGEPGSLNATQSVGRFTGLVG